MENAVHRYSNTPISKKGSKLSDATHCTDISYVVGNHIVTSLEWNESDYKMIDITTRLWTNFAKYGWEQVIADRLKTKSFAEIRTEPKMKCPFLKKDGNQRLLKTPKFTCPCLLSPSFNRFTRYIFENRLFSRILPFRTVVLSWWRSFSARQNQYRISKIQFPLPIISL